MTNLVLLSSMLVTNDASYHERIWDIGGPALRYVNQKQVWQVHRIGFQPRYVASSFVPTIVEGEPVYLFSASNLVGTLTLTTQTNWTFKEAK